MDSENRCSERFERSGVSEMQDFARCVAAERRRGTLLSFNRSITPDHKLAQKTSCERGRDLQTIR
ncbi:hypothetical protein, partial [Raoultibacter timonensis]|uniref:hypothetical protein n=1 Tax=Raoultibacter timonensis TaxID=1907662 RepID=UPI001CA5E8C5